VIWRAIFNVRDIGAQVWEQGVFKGALIRGAEL